MPVASACRILSARGRAEDAAPSAGRLSRFTQAGRGTRLIVPEGASGCAVAFVRSDGLAPEPPADRAGTGSVWLYNEVPACQVLPWRGSKEVRAIADPELGMPATFSIPRTNDLERAMTAVMIGVDPHKGSHTAVVISPAEEPLGEIRVRASAAQAGKLAEWAAAWPDDLGGRGRCRAGPAAGPAARRRRSAGPGRPAEAGVPGAAAAGWRHEQERPERCPVGGDRGAAVQDLPRGGRRGPPGGAEGVVQAPP